MCIRKGLRRNEGTYEKPNILIIGSIFMDLIFEGLPKLAEFGESISCKSYSYVPGGKGANQAKHALNRKKYDMILIQLEMPLETVYQTYEMASEQNIPVFLDAGPAMTIPLERLRGIFVISPNEVETKALTGIIPDTLEHVQQAAQKLFEMVHPRYAILKLGSRGAFYYDGTTSKMIPAFQDITAVDSTAAGDTFGGAFATVYCNGMSVLDAICYANAAAAILLSSIRIFAIYNIWIQTITLFLPSFIFLLQAVTRGDLFAESVLIHVHP